MNKATTRTRLLLGGLVVVMLLSASSTTLAHKGLVALQSDPKQWVMVLHEYYFGNLKSGGSGSADKVFTAVAEKTFGSFDLWKTDFVSVGKMRGVGWAICYQDPNSGALSNHWITLHEVGNVSGYSPILVMDAWEHAFILDYAPADRPKYIDAFFANIDWGAVQSRLSRKSIAPAA